MPKLTLAVGMFRKLGVPLVLSALSAIVLLGGWGWVFYYVSFVDPDPSGGPAFAMFFGFMVPSLLISGALDLVAWYLLYRPSRVAQRKSWRFVCFAIFSIPAIVASLFLLFFFFLPLLRR